MTKPFPNPTSLTEQMMNFVWKVSNDMATVATLLSERITKAAADKAYLPVDGKAKTAGSADEATKATKDGLNRVISDTYLTKDETAKSAESANTANTANTAKTAETANTANAVAWANVSGRPALGALSGKDAIATDDVSSSGINFGSIA